MGWGRGLRWGRLASRSLSQGPLLSPQPCAVSGSRAHSHSKYLLNQVHSRYPAGQERWAGTPGASTRG